MLTLGHPPLRWRGNRLVRLLSDVRFGLTILTLILVYASIGSAFAPLRGGLEMTEMQVFQHWLFVALIALFTASLVTATLTRVRWSVVNAGSVVVHAGLLLLVGGAVWYFARKVEGDVPLFSPRVEVFASVSALEPGAEFLADVGQGWEVDLPGLGGRVRLEVVGVTAGAGAPFAQATVALSVAGNPIEEVTLAANADKLTPLRNGLALRLRTYPPQERFYEAHAPALYYGRRGEGRSRFVRLAGLPLHRERYLSEGPVLRDTHGRLVPSKREYPHLPLAGLRIPTNWLEPWRMPLKLDTPDLPCDVEITGYLPYVVGMDQTVGGGGDRENPIAEFLVEAGGRSVTLALAALQPPRAGRGPFEFHWVASAAEMDELLRPLAGPAELTFKVLDPPIEQTLAVRIGQNIPIAGTPYELTVASIVPAWPLVTPGFEGAQSAAALVDVRRGETRFRRSVVERYPQLTQDIDDQGVRHTETLLDPNLVLRFRTTVEGRMVLAAGPDLPPVLAVFQPDGSVQRFAAERGRAQPVSVPDFTARFTLLALERFGRWLEVPLIQPLELRRPNMDRSYSAIRVKLTGRGPYAGWSESRWCLFSEYPRLDRTNAPPTLHTRVTTVRLPDGHEYELVYSRAERDLGATLVPAKLTTRLFPGRHRAESWRSDFFVQPRGGTALLPAAVYTNQTCTVAGWTLFQSGAAGDHWSWTILGVGNRHGMVPMVIGSLLITLGCLYAFYVKPVLLRRAVGDRAAAPGAEAATVAPDSLELAEVRP